MRALSIKQPWLWAITDLDKVIENRSWTPHRHLVGQRIALHASKNDDPAGRGGIEIISGKLSPLELPRGAIVATAELVGWFGPNNTRYIPKAGYDHLKNNKWFFGKYGWVLDDIRKEPHPIPCRGHLGLWIMGEEIEFQLETVTLS